MFSRRREARVRDKGASAGAALERPAHVDDPGPVGSKAQARALPALQHAFPLAVEGESWDLTDAAVRQKIGGQTETVCDYTIEGIDGLGTGHGIIEFLLLGSYQPYGFNAWSDVAK